MMKMGNYAIYCKNVNDLKRVLRKFDYISNYLGVESHWSSGKYVTDCDWLYDSCPVWIYFNYEHSGITLTWDKSCLLEPLYEVIDIEVFLKGVSTMKKFAVCC